MTGILFYKFPHFGLLPEVNVTLDFVLSNFILHGGVITFVIQGLVE